MTAVRSSSRHNQISAAIMLSVVVLMVSRVACSRPSLDLVALRQYEVAPLLEELMRINDNEDALYTELKMYHQQQTNYLSKWPGLRDLVLTDYDDNINNNNNIESSNDEAFNSRFLERLRQLAVASNVADLEDVRENSDSEMAMPTSTPMSQQKSLARVPSIFKDHGTKKNVQYMSPCHFKICNMGRKRNVRYFNKN